MHFAQPNCLKYLKLHFYTRQENENEVKKNILSSCTQLEKFGCLFNESQVDIISRCITQNSESLKCIEIEFWASQLYRVCKDQVHLSEAIQLEVL